MQIKIFESINGDVRTLEQEVNLWLRTESPSITDMVQSESHGSVDDGDQHTVTITFLFIPRNDALL